MIFNWINSEIHTETHYNQTVEIQRQREHLKTRKREANHYVQWTLNKPNS